MSKHRDIDFFKHPAAEREWQAQEAAMRAARQGRAPADAREAAYRHIDAALRGDDAIDLPADFAEQLAVKAGPVPTAATAPETGLEKQLTRLLLQFNDAARSIRALADLLNRHPEALVRGRTDTGAE